MVGVQKPLPQLMAHSAAGQLAVARLPPRGLPPQPQGAGGSQTGRPGLFGAQQPGGACLHLPAAQHRCHPACMYSRPPACRCPCSLAVPLPELGERMEGEVRAKAHRWGAGSRERPRKMSETAPGDGQGGGRVPRRLMVTLRPPSLGCAQTRPTSGQRALCPRRGWQGVGRPWERSGRVRGGNPRPQVRQQEWGGARPERVGHRPCTWVLWG